MPRLQGVQGERIRGLSVHRLIECCLRGVPRELGQPRGKPFEGELQVPPRLLHGRQRQLPEVCGLALLREVHGHDVPQMQLTADGCSRQGLCDVPTYRHGRPSGSLVRLCWNHYSFKTHW